MLYRMTLIVWLYWSWFVYITKNGHLMSIQFQVLLWNTPIFNATPCTANFNAELHLKYIKMQSKQQKCFDSEIKFVIHWNRRGHSWFIKWRTKRASLVYVCCCSLCQNFRMHLNVNSFEVYPIEKFTEDNQSKTLIFTEWKRNNPIIALNYWCNRTG